MLQNLDHKYKIFIFLFKKLNWKFLIKFTILALLFSDEIYFYSNYPHFSLVRIIFYSFFKRYARILRPLWLLFHSREVMNTTKSIVLSFSKVIDTFLFFILLSLFFAYLGSEPFYNYPIRI